jgi:BirA family transcriptional regulator, biotin operon repressor / biotin---[acetyl-CoA-carboxylase] ligase
MFFSVLTGPPGTLSGYGHFDSWGAPMATPYDIVRVAGVGSTQDEARRLVGTGIDTVLVIADTQVAGRGRQGRTWLAPDQGVFASLSFTCTWPPDRFPLIPLCAAVAARTAVVSLTGVPVGCKWPNDLVLGGRKVGGLLAEATGDRVTLGWGLNLWWAEPPPYAAVLLPAPGEEELASDLARSWADAVLGIIAEGPDAWPVDAYRSACITLGAEVRWDGGAGRATEVDDHGRLVVEGPEAVHVLVSGDVHLLEHG